MVQAADSNEDDRPRVRVVLGPDLEDFEDVALGVLLENEFSVSPQADRVGTRLVGPRLLRKVALAAARRPSMPMVRGAIQVPPDGQPIVLGPDHPTTGGYPLIGVVVSADVEKVVAAPVGRVLRFARALPA